MHLKTYLATYFLQQALFFFFFFFFSKPFFSGFSVKGKNTQENLTPIYLFINKFSKQLV